MKYLSLTLVIIAAMVANMVADLNFADGSHDAEGWDSICGAILLFTLVTLLILAVLDTIREFSR